jgi:hypothetical protein
MTVVPQLPYTPDLVLCDFFLFPKFKQVLKRKRIIDDVIAAIKKIKRTTVYTYELHNTGFQ